MGCTDPLRRGARCTPSVSSRIGGKLPLPLYADVRLHIPMTHRNAAGTQFFGRLDTLQYATDGTGELSKAIPLVMKAKHVNVMYTICSNLLDSEGINALV